jgi:TolA-binding protein
MEAYNKAIEMNGVDADYAAFQKAISYGFVSRNDKKIEDLNTFIKRFTKSQYLDDALFELGNTYTNQGNDNLAIKTYDALIQEFKNSSFTARAILRQGLIYYNANQSDLAIQKLKKVVSDFPRTPESVEAVATARQIYVDKGQVDIYASWAKTLDFIEITDNEIDQITYESAEKMYLQNNTKGAVSGFSTYLSQFPKGSQILKASFYLAQLYFADGLENNAIEHYEFVIAQNRNEFTEQALARLSEIYLKKKDFSHAITVLKRLEQEADFPQNKIFAQSNLMKVYYEQQDFQNSVQYADLVLANSKMDDRVRSDAQIIVARAAIKTGNEAKAKESYLKLLTIAQGELAAEAIYYDAYFKNKEGKFDASNEALQKIIKEYSGYKYFLLKGLILMSKNSYAAQDFHSAIHLLENIMPNTVEFQDLNEEAAAVLQAFKTEQAQQNVDIKN